MDKEVLVTTTIQLNQYRALADGAALLRLGTRGSYGIEQLQLQPGDGWQGLTVTAVFSAGGQLLAPPVTVPENGLLAVPPGATARALTPDAPGMVVFCGEAEGVRRVTANLPFLVSDHAPADGEVPPPEPDVWEQLTQALAEQLTQQMRGELTAAVPEDGQPGQVLTCTEAGNAWADPRGGYQIGAGLTLDPDTNTLRVDTAEAVEQDNTRPVTSAAVYTTVGNIDALLATL